MQVEWKREEEGRGGAGTSKATRWAPKVAGHTEQPELRRRKGSNSIFTRGFVAYFFLSQRRLQYCFPALLNDANGRKQHRQADRQKRERDAISRSISIQNHTRSQKAKEVPLEVNFDKSRKWEKIRNWLVSMFLFMEDC